MSVFGDAFGSHGAGASAGSVSVSSEAIAKAFDVWRGCAVSQHAFDAYLGELQRCELEWARDDGPAPPEVPVPAASMWRLFVRDTARNFLVCGFSAGVRVGVCSGVIVARALHPHEMSARYSKHCRLKVDGHPATGLRSKHAVVTATLDAPCVSTGELASCAHRALDSCQRHAELVSNYLARDARNTHPSVYTTVQRDLSTGSGTDTSTWFSPRGVSSFNDRDFNALVSARERTLHSLTTITDARRENETGTSRKDHVEHIVTDGQAFSEARQLASQPENRTFKDQLVLEIYKFYKVPPSAVFGEQVNAERAGVGLGSSSAAMQARCVQNWNETMTVFIGFLNEALKAQSMTPGGSYLQLVRPVTADVVAKLTPMLKPAAVIKHMARLSGIPAEDFDADRLAAEGTSEPDRKQKRSRLEREQAFATAPT